MPQYKRAFEWKVSIWRWWRKHFNHSTIQSIVWFFFHFTSVVLLLPSFHFSIWFTFDYPRLNIYENAIGNDTEQSQIYSKRDTWATCHTMIFIASHRFRCTLLCVLFKCKNFTGTWAQHLWWYILQLIYQWEQKRSNI